MGGDGCRARCVSVSNAHLDEIVIALSRTCAHPFSAVIEDAYLDTAMSLVLCKPTVRRYSLLN